MEHYFTRKPTSPERILLIEDTLRGNHLQFKTSSGVFSKNRIDFGTKILVETVTVKGNDRVVDVGCGYGVIGISLSFFCDSVLLIDINERACQLAKENIASNSILNAYVVSGSPACLHKIFDVVVMNPPIRAGKKVVFQLIEESRACLKKEGKFYAVARTRQGAKSIYSFMCSKFSAVEYAALKGGYRVIKGSA